MIEEGRGLSPTILILTSKACFLPLCCHIGFLGALIQTAFKETPFNPNLYDLSSEFVIWGVTSPGLWGPLGSLAVRLRGERGKGCDRKVCRRSMKSGWKEGSTHDTDIGERVQGICRTGEPGDKPYQKA